MGVSHKSENCYKKSHNKFLKNLFGKLVHIFGMLVHIFRKLVHVLGKLVHIFGKLVRIFTWKLVSRTSKQVSRNLGPLWQPGVYNDTNLRAFRGFVPISGTPSLFFKAGVTFGESLGRPRPQRLSWATLSVLGFWNLGVFRFLQRKWGTSTEASKSVSTKTLSIKHDYRRQGLCSWYFLR